MMSSILSGSSSWLGVGGAGLPIMGLALCVVSVRFLTGSLRVPLLECWLRLGSVDGAIVMSAVDGRARGPRRSAPPVVTQHIRAGERPDSLLL